jgi:hypothetical protein
MVEYVVKGIVHAGMLNPWPVNKVGIFENVTQEINQMSEEGYELVETMIAGNMDRGIYIFRKKK